MERDAQNIFARIWQRTLINVDAHLAKLTPQCGSSTTTSSLGAIKSASFDLLGVSVGIGDGVIVLSSASHSQQTHATDAGIPDGSTVPIETVTTERRGQFDYVCFEMRGKLRRLPFLIGHPHTSTLLRGISEAKVLHRARIEAERAENARLEQLELERSERARALQEQIAFDDRTRALVQALEAAEQTLDPIDAELQRLAPSRAYLRRSVFSQFSSRTRQAAAAIRQIDQIIAERPSLRPTRDFSKLRSAIQNPAGYIEWHNAYWSAQEVQRYSATLHSDCGLSDEQADAAVRSERQVIVSAPAGSGKTRMLEGKAEYLIASGGARQEDILLLTFASRTRADLKRRIVRHSSLKKVRVATFHGLGRWILMQRGALRPITQLAKHRKNLKAWVDERLRDLLARGGPTNPLRRFIEQGITPIPPSHDVDIEDYFERTAHITMRSIDNVRVRSLEELAIANWLYLHSIRYEYESSYFRKEVDQFSGRQYCPDFYIPDARAIPGDATPTRPGMYHEHLALDRHDQTPAWIDGDKYRKSVTWKDDLHKEVGTKLEMTRSADFHDGTIFDRLRAIYGPRVTLRERSAAEIIEALGKRFSLLSNTFVGFFDIARAKRLDSATLRARLSASDHRGHAFLDVYDFLVREYYDHLDDAEEMDFEDMIRDATDQIESGAFVPQWSHVMVDEYQDVSENQIAFIEALNRSATQLFCVGDRRQAIYAFRGSELDAMERFEERFGDVDSRCLSWTFRSPAEIAEAANDFVAGNQPWHEPVQAAALGVPCIRIIGVAPGEDQRKFDPFPTLAGFLERLSRDNPRSTIMVLGRYGDHVPHVKDLPKNGRAEAMTIHRAKGLEADHVVLTDAVGGWLSFPSTRSPDPVFRMLGDDDQRLQEKNLMYVALTRAAKSATVLTDWNEPSPFVDELIRLGAVAVNAPPIDSRKLSCDKCGKGRLVSRFGKYVCSLNPLCEAYYDTCPRRPCQGILRGGGTDLICSDCEGAIKRCPQCDAGYLRTVGTGNLIGCSRYRGSQPVFSCNYMRSLVRTPRAWNIWESPSGSSGS